MLSLRCPSKLLGIVIEDDVLELPCTSRFCGKRRGVVVRHRFDLKTGALIETLRFKEPPTTNPSRREV